MPLYDFRCSEGHVFERSVPLADFEEVQHCSCQSPAVRLISRPMFMVENIGYDCPVTGKWISSRSAHQDNLARQGCRVLEGGEKEAAAKYRQDADAALDRQIEATVEKSIDAMPSAKKETLFNELTRQGLSAEVVRS